MKNRTSKPDLRKSPEQLLESQQVLLSQRIMILEQRLLILRKSDARRKTSGIPVMMLADEFSAIDERRRNATLDLPSHSEVIRRLVELG